MSAEVKASGSPTNDEIIDELTKDLEEQCTTDDQQPVDEDEPQKPSLPDDYIDEDALKDLEQSLTDEELELRRKSSLELKARGNGEFKSSEYLASVETYTEALRLCPLKFAEDRAILYANRAASKVQLERQQTAIDDCSKAIELNPTYVRALMRRAKLYEETDKLDECLGDWKRVLEVDPGNSEGRAACVRLPPLIDERNEKLKAEMLGKLKDLGNMFLKPFGLSTDNFKMQQDPNTGGYSVNFQQ